MWRPPCIVTRGCRRLLTHRPVCEGVAAESVKRGISMHCVCLAHNAQASIGASSAKAMSSAVLSKSMHTCSLAVWFLVQHEASEGCRQLTLCMASDTGCMHADPTIETDISANLLLLGGHAPWCSIMVPPLRTAHIGASLGQASRCAFRAVCIGFRQGRVPSINM